MILEGLSSCRDGVFSPPLSFTRYSLSSKLFVQESILFFANTPLVWAPHYPPLSPRPLRNTRFPPDHPLLQCMPYYVGTGNIMQRPLPPFIAHTIAQYSVSHRPSFIAMHAIQHWYWQYHVKTTTPLYRPHYCAILCFPPDHPLLQCMPYNIGTGSIM